MSDSLLANPAPKLLAHFGSRVAAARHFKVSTESIRLWLRDGIPTDRALDAEEATRGSEHAVTATEVLLYAKQQRDAASVPAQLSLPG